MKIHYTGKLDGIDPVVQKKLDARFARLGKLLDRKSEKETHVILTAERHIRRAEITVNHYDHLLSAVHDSGDFASSLMSACDKLEKQLLRLRDKRIGSKRRAGRNDEPAPAVETPLEVPVVVPRVFRARVTRKPMTLEEATIELDGDRVYIAYRDAETGRVNVLLRRADRNFDLIEA